MDQVHFRSRSAIDGCRDEVHKVAGSQPTDHKAAKIDGCNIDLSRGTNPSFSAMQVNAGKIAYYSSWRDWSISISVWKDPRVSLAAQVRPRVVRQRLQGAPARAGMKVADETSSGVRPCCTAQLAPTTSSLGS